MKLFLNNWVKIAKIVTVIWVISGMWRTIKPKFALPSLESKGPMWLFVLFYFFSAILVLFLLKGYEKRGQ